MKSFILSAIMPYLLRSVWSASVPKTIRRAIQGTPPLLFRGCLLDDLGDPIAKADVQLWQTDPDGIYKHPNVETSDSFEPTFQYFGTAKTLKDGSFWFLTHRPGIYTGRPTHFHYKIWFGGEEKLTSQFYFADENTTYSKMQVIDLQEHDFGEGGMGFVADKTIVVNLNLGGDGPFTPLDREGPFYPVVDFFGYGNDLINWTLSSDGFSDSTAAAPVTSPANPSAVNADSTVSAASFDESASGGSSAASFLLCIPIAILFGIF